MKITLKNFLTTLRRYKTASLLNVAGLTLAFTAFYVIASQVWFSLTYNRSLRASDRTYLVSCNFGDGAGNSSWSFNSPGALAFETQKASPEAEEVAAIMSYPTIDRVWIKHNELHFEPFNEFVYQGTPNLPDFFGFEPLSGNFDELKEPNTLIVARSMAEKLGVGVGDTIWFEDSEEETPRPTNPQRVVAIYEDMPDNTLFKHWKIIRGDEGVYTETNNNWNYSNFVRIREDADTENYVRIFRQRYADWFEGMAAEWIARWPEDEAEIRSEIAQGRHLLPTRLVRLDKLYFAGRDFTSGNFRTGSRSETAILVAVALTIVVIAFINFINFFFALVPVRLRAVNICKVFGASQRTLRWNFLFEAIGLVLLAMVMTLYLMVALQKSFLTQYSVSSLALEDNLPVIAMIVVLMVVLAVIAALYPAFYITRFNASLGVKGGFAQSATGRTLRSVMVGVQFTVAMVLIIVTAVIFLQYRYMVNFDTGIDTRNIMILSSWDLSHRSETLVERLQQHPDVEDVTTSSSNLFHAGSLWGREYNEKQYQLYVNFVRWNFPAFFGLELVDGQTFTPSSGERGELVITQNLNREIGVPIGHVIDERNTVTGFVKDVRIHSAALDERYNAFVCDARISLPHFYLRIREGADVKALAAFVDNLLKEFAPVSRNTELHRLEESVEELYAQTRKEMVLLGMFAVLAIVIAQMGVFGIVLFEMQHRRAEIALRRIYGATEHQIMQMLVRRYVWIVSCCFVISVPVARIITGRWIEQFVHRIGNSWWLYPVSFGMVLLITVSLVLVQTWRAATENPADVIRKRH